GLGAAGNLEPLPEPAAMAGIVALRHPAAAPSSASDVPHPSRRSLHGLDWFVFFVADVQAGFGPFVAVYLTTQKWTQFDIGLVMTVAGLVALIGQVPGGALVDAARSERVVAGAAAMHASPRSAPASRPA